MNRDELGLALAATGLVVSVFSSCMPNLADVYASSDTDAIRRAQIAAAGLAMASAVVVAGAARSWPVLAAGLLAGGTLAVAYGKARQA
jgi:hypothetical protein